MTRGPPTPSIHSLLSRRRFLRTATATAALGASGVAGGQATATFTFDGTIPGWVGRSPESIAGQTNPDLRLTPGERYEITWTNVDGEPHNFVILDADGSPIASTDTTSTEGATLSVNFTATEAMAEYYCEYHQGSMRGTVRLTGESSTQTTTPTDDPPTERFMPRGASVGLETVVDGGMTAPLALEVPPESDRRFVVDQVGGVYTLDGGGLEPFIDIGNRLVNFDNLPDEKVIDERGLLGLAFHPNYRENRKFYLHYSAPPRPGTPEGYTHTQVLSEFRATEDFSAGIPDSEHTILEIPSPYYTHNAGEILFGPEDGYLYMGMGNGGGSLLIEGNAGDWYENRGGNGQDVDENLLGSILRIDVDSREDGKPYGIPNDNPLVGEKGLDEQFAWGFRNPWRMSFERGNLFVCDVGQFNYEEVSIVTKGRNYGWNVREGTHCFVSAERRAGGDTVIDECPDRTPPDVRGGEPLVPPIIEYPHTHEDEPVGSAVTGGTIYENATIPDLRGKFVFGDYSASAGDPSGSVFAATPPQDGQWSLEEVTFEGLDGGTLDSYVLGVYPDSRGELYVLTTDNLGVRGKTGKVRKIQPPEPETTTRPATATPEQPPTATPTPTPTPTPTETPTPTPTETPTATPTETPTETPTPTSERPVTAATDTTHETTATNTGESEGWISRVDGPGFGVLAALTALGGVAVRLLSERE